jgi:hypothetical protein
MPAARPEEADRMGLDGMRWTVLALAVLLAGGTARALEAPPAPAAEKAAEPAVEKAAPQAAAEGGADEVDARAVLERMASFLAGQKRFSFSVDFEYDSVQADGQKLEFGETRRIALRRPDHLRIDGVRRTGERRGLIYDGQQITAFDLDDNVYASAARSGSIDDTVRYVVDDLQIRTPLSELLSTGLPDVIRNAADLAEWVEQASIGGVTCDHVAARNPEADIQAWVQRGDVPLLRRLVITYKQSPGQPQFRATFSSWNFEAELPDALFAFKPAEGAQRVPFVAPARAAAPDATQPAAPEQPAASPAAEPAP